jgi:hypothetical protein
MAKRKPRQPTKAELEAEASYAKMMAKWDKAPKFARTSHSEKPSANLSTTESMSAPPGRFTSHGIKSHSTPGGYAPMQQNRMYSGDKVLGIATLHKSIAQPIFSSQEAVEVATMRRN